MAASGHIENYHYAQILYSEANVIPLFQGIEVCWNDFLDSYHWNIIFAVEIETGWQMLCSAFMKYAWNIQYGRYYMSEFIIDK